MADQPVNAGKTAIPQPTYPLLVYGFRAMVSGISMSFAEISGLAIAYDHLVYRHGLSYAEGEQIVTFAFDAFAPITLKRGTIPDAYMLALYDWLKSRELRSMHIVLHDAANKPVLAWSVAKAVPVKLTAPTFDPKSNEVAIDVLEVQARGVSLDRI